MKLAYLTNRYPAVSHTFIRDEIGEVERLGHPVTRFSVRPADSGLCDARDIAEAAKTRYVLADRLGIIRSVFRYAVRHPCRLVQCLTKAAGWGFCDASGVIKNIAYVIEAAYLSESCRHLGIEHVHAHFGTNSAAVAMWCRCLDGPPFSFTVHGAGEMEDPRRLRLREKIAAASFVVAVSHYGRSQLYRACDVRDWAKIRIIHCAPSSLFAERGSARPDNCADFVCVARLDAVKGHLVLLEALGQLRTRGMRPTVTLVGDGPMRESLLDAIKQQSLGDSVRMAGSLSGEEVREAISGAKCLILPSFFEGVPVALMEAMMLGRPVVATYVGGIPELVENGVSGWLVPPGSVEALADAMEKVLAAPVEKLTAMGLAGRQKVLRDHNAATEAAKLAELFLRAADAVTR